MSEELIDGEASVTPVVQAAMAQAPDPRLRALMACLVEHLHAFVRETKLTAEEFEAGLKFVTEIGQQTHDSHNEVVLAADVLGVSTLVALLNNPASQGQTATALLGPFWRRDAPLCVNGDSIARTPSPHAPLAVSGRVRAVGGAPIAGATVDVWQASPVGLYENQDPQQEEMNLRGRFLSDGEGRYWFRSVRPAGYPVPTSGSVGRLLALQRRHPFRPAHLHFMVSAPGYRTLVTQVFADDAEHLASDVVFGVTRPLVGRFRPEGEGFTLAYDFVLEQGPSTFPEPPIR